MHSCESEPDKRLFCFTMLPWIRQNGIHDRRVHCLLFGQKHTHTAYEYNRCIVLVQSRCTENQNRNLQISSYQNPRMNSHGMWRCSTLALSCCACPIENSHHCPSTSKRLTKPEALCAPDAIEAPASNEFSQPSNRGAAHQKLDRSMHVVEWKWPGSRRVHTFIHSQFAHGTIVARSQ